MCANRRTRTKKSTSGSLKPVRFLKEAIVDFGEFHAGPVDEHGVRDRKAPRSSGDEGVLFLGTANKNAAGKNRRRSLAWGRKASAFQSSSHLVHKRSKFT